MSIKKNVMQHNRYLWRCPRFNPSPARRHDMWEDPNRHECSKIRNAFWQMNTDVWAFKKLKRSIIAIYEGVQDFDPSLNPEANLLESQNTIPGYSCQDRQHTQTTKVTTIACTGELKGSLMYRVDRSLAHLVYRSLFNKVKRVLLLWVNRSLLHQVNRSLVLQCTYLEHGDQGPQLSCH